MRAPLKEPKKFVHDILSDWTSDRVRQWALSTCSMMATMWNLHRDKRVVFWRAIDAPAWVPYVPIEGWRNDAVT